MTRNTSTFRSYVMVQHILRTKLLANGNHKGTGCALEALTTSLVYNVKYGCKQSLVVPLAKCFSPYPFNKRCHWCLHWLCYFWQVSILNFDVHLFFSVHHGSFKGSLPSSELGWMWHWHTLENGWLPGHFSSEPGCGLRHIHRQIMQCGAVHADQLEAHIQTNV